MEGFLSDNSNATSVQQPLKQENNLVHDFVRICVSQNGEEIITLMMSLQSAYDVINSFLEINTPRLSSAQNPVQCRFIGKEEVYNLTVKDDHEFFAEGILVKNCLDGLRYALFSHFFGKDGLEVPANELENRFLESRGLKSNLPRFFQDPIDPQYRF